MMCCNNVCTCLTDGLNLVAVAIGIGESDMCFKQGAEAHRFALDPEIQNKLHIRASDQPGNILLQDPPDRLYSKDLHKWGFCDKKDMVNLLFVSIFNKWTTSIQFYTSHC